jgi:hypothetical protein
MTNLNKVVSALRTEQSRLEREGAECAREWRRRLFDQET